MERAGVTLMLTCCAVSWDILLVRHLLDINGVTTRRPTLSVGLHAQERNGTFKIARDTISGQDIEVDTALVTDMLKSSVVQVGLLSPCLT